MSPQVGRVKPRRDQIESVMRRSGCSYSQAVAVCEDHFRKWRDTPRKWISLTTWSGGDFVVEDR